VLKKIVSADNGAARKMLHARFLLVTDLSEGWRQWSEQALAAYQLAFGAPGPG